MAAQKQSQQPEEELPEQLSQQQNEQALQEQAPEISQFGTFFAQALGIFAYFQEPKAKTFNAFNYLKNSEKLTVDILDLKDPQKFQQAIEAHKLVGKRFADDKKRVAEKGYAQASFFGKKTRMTQEELQRRSNALSIARAVHKQVNNEELNIKVQKAASLYGFDEEQQKLLRQNLAKRMKEEPGRGLDEHLYAECRARYRAQKAGETPQGQKPTQEQKKAVQQADRELAGRNGLEAQLKKTNKDARQAAITNQQGCVDRGNEALQKIFDPNQPLPSAQEIHQILEQVKTGQAAPRPPSEEVLARGFTEGADYSWIEQEGLTPMVPTLAAVPPPPPAPTPIAHPPSSVLSKPASFFKSFLGKGLGKLKLLRSLLSKGLTSLLGPAGLALNALNTVTSLFGVDLNMLALAIGAVVVLAIMLPIFFLFFFISSNLHLFGPGKTPIKAYNPPSPVFSWSTFEQQYLTVKRNNENSFSTDWNLFVEKHLARPRPWLSLDSDRHNDVEE